MVFLLILIKPISTPMIWRKSPMGWFLISIFYITFNTYLEEFGKMFNQYLLYHSVKVYKIDFRIKANSIYLFTISFCLFHQVANTRTICHVPKKWLIKKGFSKSKRDFDKVHSSLKQCLHDLWKSWYQLKFDENESTTF